MSPNPELLNQQNGTVAEGLLGHPDVEILNIRERGAMVDAMVPMDLIETRGVPVDAAHVKDLTTSIASVRAETRGTGQMVAVLLAEVQDSSRLVVIDGFHRVEAMRNNGSEQILASIKRGIKPDDVLKERITTATHVNVNFARIVEWVHEDWGQSPWKDKITALQAFTLLNGNGSGRNLRLTPDEVKAIKQWTGTRCEQWQTAPATIQKNLAMAEDADPAIVRMVRRGRTSGNNPFTAQHLRVVAKGFTGHRFGMQQFVAELTQLHRLSLPALRALVRELGSAQTMKEAVDITNGLNWNEIIATPVPVAAKARRQDGPLVRKQTPSPQITSVQPRESHIAIAEIRADLSHELLVSELLFAKAALRNFVYQGRYVVPLRQTESGGRRLYVSYRDDSEVTGIATAQDVDENMLNFSIAAERQAVGLLGVLRREYGKHAGEAEEIVREATGRVLSDIQHGDLRFVDVRKNSVAYDLLASAMRMELGRGRTGQTLTQPPEVGGNAPSVSLVELVRGLPRMTRKERAAVLMHGVLGITVPTTAVILGEPGNMPRILDAAKGKVLGGVSGPALAEEAS